jgi:hypothetical protein
MRSTADAGPAPTTAPTTLAVRTRASTITSTSASILALPLLPLIWLLLLRAMCADTLVHPIYIQCGWTSGDAQPL